MTDELVASTVSEIIQEAKAAIQEFHEARKIQLVLTNPQSVSAVLADVTAYLISHRGIAEDLEAKINAIEKELG